MKKLVRLIALSVMLAGCVNAGTASVQKQQLQNHRFILESMNGTNVKTDPPAPEINFAEDMTVTGTMCNHFSGKGKLSGGKLTVKSLIMTRKFCIDPQRNELDRTLDDMLREGAQVDLTEQQLTLTTAAATLIFKRAD